MLAQGSKILELIPQRPPMVMVDTLEYCDKDRTLCSLLPDEGNIFVIDGFFSEAGMMELMAQTAALRTGWLASLDSGGKTFKAPIGVIGSINGFKLHDRAPAGVKLNSEVIVQNEIFNATLVTCRVYTEDKLLAESGMKIFITED